MADFDLTLIEPENLSQAETYEIDFVSGHSVGDLVDAAGAVVDAITDVHGGIVVRAGDANGAKTLVMRRGLVRTNSVHGLAAGALIYSDGDNTASDAEPAGAAGTRITELGVALSTTRALIDISSYEKGA